MLCIVKNRLASFNCCLVYQDADLVKIFHKLHYQVKLRSKYGNNGFGYDEIFLSKRI